ncbi:MAG: TrmB family transcriptional regulator [Candidatus Bathyarchaeota archaeon]|nr:TrmB family transcriptional regulator [Candidatus Bathyarchaeota archaeon]
MEKPFISTKVEKSLREIGLTEYECLAYIALVRYGELTASQVSEHTSIPYSKVYSVLDSLDRKGWIEIEGGRPRLYYPRPPVEALEAERLRKENRFEQFREAVVSELQPLYERRDVKEKPEIWIIRGVENIASAIKEIPQKVQRELMLALPEIQPELATIVLPTLELLRDKRVDIHLLTTTDLVASLENHIAHVAEIRVKKEMFGGGVVIDGRETLLFLGRGVTEEQNLAIWSDHVGLTMIAKIYFEQLWDTAEPVEEA